MTRAPCVLPTPSRAFPAGDANAALQRLLGLDGVVNSPDAARIDRQPR